LDEAREIDEIIGAYINRIKVSLSCLTASAAKRIDMRAVEMRIY
jgi:hypothetical protein